MLNEIIQHIHPIIVHFPIAMIVVGLCYDFIIAFRKRSLSPIQGLWIWLVSAISAWGAVMTGPDDDARGNTAFIETHSTLADITACVVTFLVLWRLWMLWRGNRAFVKTALVGYLLISFLSCALVLGTGYYGGKMVYSDGVGVKSNGVEVNPPRAGH